MEVSCGFNSSHAFPYIVYFARYDKSVRQSIYFVYIRLRIPGIFKYNGRKSCTFWNEALIIASQGYWEGIVCMKVDMD